MVNSIQNAQGFHKDNRIFPHVCVSTYNMLNQCIIIQVSVHDPDHQEGSYWVTSLINWSTFCLWPDYPPPGNYGICRRTGPMPQRNSVLTLHRHKTSGCRHAYQLAHLSRLSVIQDCSRQQQVVVAKACNLHTCVHNQRHFKWNVQEDISIHSHMTNIYHDSNLT